MTIFLKGAVTFYLDLNDLLDNQTRITDGSSYFKLNDNSMVLTEAEV